MNKYLVSIPYSYTQYGDLDCYIYADSEEEAYDLAKDSSEREGEDYNDGSSDSTEYRYDDMIIEETEEDVEDSELPRRLRETIPRTTSPSVGTTNPMTTDFSLPIEAREPTDSREAMEDLFEDISKL